MTSPIAAVDEPATSSSVRQAALWVPDWPVAAAVAEGLAEVDQPLAIHDGQGVLLCSATARSQGVRSGMSRRSAQQMCPELVLLGVDDTRDARSFEPIVQAVEAVAAGVQVLRPGIVLLPARGPSRYAGSEEQLADQLIGAVAEESGAECQVGIGEGLLTVLLAAREGSIVAPGSAREFLACHNVNTVQLAAPTRRGRAELAELTDLLHRLGLRTLGDLTALPAGDVAARFGGTGVLAHRLAGGGDVAPPAQARPEQDIIVRHELDPPADRADVAAFVARSLAETLVTRLQRRGVVCGALCVRARTTDGAELVRSWRMDGAPSPAELTDRVRWQLDGWLAGRSSRPPSAPLVHLELVAEEVSPAGSVGEGLWGSRSQGQVQAERAALRVQSLLGAEGVLVPVLQGGRDPASQTRLVAWGDEADPLLRPDAPWPGQLPAPTPATVLTEPLPLSLRDAEGIEVDVSARGLLSARPAQLLMSPAPHGAAQGAHRPTLPVVPGNYLVHAWAGPWPVTERWWSSTPRRRAWLQLLAHDAPVLLLSRYEGQWHLMGVYD